MPDDDVKRERRTRQFEHYIGLMEDRTCRLMKSDCFLIFTVPAPRSIRRRLGGATHLVVQFAFMGDGFYLDLPDTTLTPEQARRAVAERPSFDFALNKEQKRLGERQFDPVQRSYRYHEKRVAAEDAAYVFFDLLQTPLDAWITVNAASFDGSRHWERRFAMG